MDCRHHQFTHMRSQPNHHDPLGGLYRRTGGVWPGHKLSWVDFNYARRWSRQLARLSAVNRHQRIKLRSASSECSTNLVRQIEQLPIRHKHQPRGFCPNKKCPDQQGIFIYYCMIIFYFDDAQTRSTNPNQAQTCPETLALALG